MPTSANKKLGSVAQTLLFSIFSIFYQESARRLGYAGHRRNAKKKSTLDPTVQEKYKHSRARLGPGANGQVSKKKLSASPSEINFCFLSLYANVAKPGNENEQVSECNLFSHCSCL